MLSTGQLCNTHIPSAGDKKIQRIAIKWIFYEDGESSSEFFSSDLHQNIVSKAYYEYLHIAVIPQWSPAPLRLVRN